MSFRFGVQFRATADPEFVRTAATTAASLGFVDVWSSDHIGAADPFLPLQFAADATSSVEVGPLVLNNEFHHPAMIARAAASLDQLSGGRFVLGLGTGYAQSEHDATAIPLRAPGARVTRFGETLEVVRTLLDDGACTFEGEHHTIAIDDLGVRPARRVPILVGGHGERVVGLAGRFADRFQFTGLTFDADGNLSPGGFVIDELDIRREWLIEAAGDRIDDIERSALVQRLTVGDDTAEARTETADAFGLSPEQLDDCPFALIGSVEQIVDKLERLRTRLGVTHYVVRDAEQFAPVVAALS
ncbi:MAG: TIGR03621 family F420-dependent LLM class oxidoreductase [Actinomycetota bacterium]